MNTEMSAANAPRPTPEPHSMAKPIDIVVNGSKPVSQAPVRPEIHFDPKEMQQHLQEALQRLNDMMKNSDRNLSFSMDAISKQTVITVKDSVTGEVIRQIPSEALLRVADNIEKVKGLLHNEQI